MKIFSLRSWKSVFLWSVILSFIVFLVLQVLHFGVRKNDCIPNSYCGVPYTVSKNLYYIGYPGQSITVDGFWNSPSFYLVCLINYLVFFVPTLVLLIIISGMSRFLVKQKA